MLRRFAPKSLLGRTIVIVVLPLFLMQSVVTFVFFNRHWEGVTASLATATASEFGLLTNEWAALEAQDARTALQEKAQDELRIDMRFVPDGTIPRENERSFFNALNRVLDRELDWSLDYPFWYDTTSFPDEVEIRVQMPDGYLMYRIDRERVHARNGHLFVLWLIGVTLLLGYTALIFLRNQVRSITRLADAAHAFGRGSDALDFKPSGAREVRLAGHAFIAMRGRIKRFLAQRTEMLAGVSHDLRTPLTRLKLQLALQPDMPGGPEMTADIAEMERLLEDYLTYARGEAEGSRERISLAEVGAEFTAIAARQNRPLIVEIPDSLSVTVQSNTFRRAVSNLLENAWRYATDVRLTATDRGDRMEIAIDDNGPGIPEEAREQAVKAFVRLDAARSSRDPGSGLGLAIVRDVARAHGGTLKLGASPLGGLRAVIAIPTGPIRVREDTNEAERT